MITPILMLGAGRLGGALIEGWRRTGAFSPGDLMIRDPQPSSAADAAAREGAWMNPQDGELAQARTVVVAVKPQIMTDGVEESL